jgi:hypothetical protein
MTRTLSVVVALALSFLSLTAETPPRVQDERTDVAASPAAAGHDNEGRGLVHDEPISGVAWYERHKQAIGARDEGPAPQRDTDATGRGVETDAFPRERYNASNDTAQDVEPAITAIGTSTLSTYIKYVPLGGNTPQPRIYSAAGNDGVPSSAVNPQLPMPAGGIYLMSGDPWMAANPMGGGTAPGRMFCTGILFNNALEDSANAVGLWRYDNGTWSAPTIIDSENGTTDRFIDKPAMALQWSQFSLAYVYVIYATVDYADSQGGYRFNTIWVARSADGGLTFPQRTAVVTGPVQMAQIAVDANNVVHAMWVNYGTNEIRKTSSTNNGATWNATHELVHAGNGTLLTRNTGTTINPNMAAPTAPMFRISGTRLSVVWHARTNNQTDVYYTSKPCSSNCTASGWRNPVMVNDSATNDQFMPAIAFNGSNAVVTFYDRREDAANTLYQSYVGYLTGDGASIHANYRMSYYPSDPRWHTNADGRVNFIGDYQDAVYYWSPTWGHAVASAWIFIESDVKNGEDYWSRIFF